MQHDNRSVMVCLISRQTMQNLLPILQYQPRQVVCITTREEDDSRTHLEAVLHAHQIPAVTPIYVDAYAPEATAHACCQIIACYGAGALLANVTGGTKIMSLAALRVFSAAQIPCIYTDTPHRRILYLHPDGHEAEPLRTHVDVLTYLQVHGQRASLRGPASRDAHPELATFIGQHITDLDPFLSRLRYEMQSTPERAHLRFTPQGKQRHRKAPEFLVLAMQLGLLEARPGGGSNIDITFRDVKARRYLEGEWLEDLVFNAVHQAGFESCAANVALAWDDAPDREMNEIDVAVVHNLRFFYLSCKTGSDAQQMKHHLFELEALSAMAGTSPGAAPCRRESGQER